MARKLVIPLALALTALVGCATTQDKSSTADSIESALLAKKERFRSCYEDSNERRSGRVNTSFTVDSDGVATQAKVLETSLNDPAVEQCILMTIKGIKFPKPKKGGKIEVTYPFKFNP